MSTVDQLFPRLPAIAATLTGKGLLIPAARAAARDGADVIELRADTFSQDAQQHLPVLLHRLRKACKKPLLLTVRAPKEQGVKPATILSDRERLALYMAGLPKADWVDVELESAIAPLVVKAARTLGKNVILSYHDFKGIPSASKIRKLMQAFKKLRGDVVKLAVTPKTRQDAAQWLKQCATLAPLPRVFIAMGAPGRVSRVAGWTFGSCLTYGSVHGAAAPGQISVQELARLRDLLYPRTQS